MASFCNITDDTPFLTPPRSTRHNHFHEGSSSRSFCVRLLCVLQRLKRSHLILILLTLAVVTAWSQNAVSKSRSTVLRVAEHLQSMKGSDYTSPYLWHHDCETQDFNTTYLKQLGNRHDLGTHIQYAQREVRYARINMARESLIKLPQDMLPNSFRLLDLSSQDERISDASRYCVQPLVVSIPHSPLPHNVNASDLLFGISTTKERLTDERVFLEWSVWLTDGEGNSNGAGLHVLLADATAQDIADVNDRLSQHGIKAEISTSDSSAEMAARYLSIVPTLFKSPWSRGRKWLVLCDDDTFYPAMNTLLARLNAMDSTLDMYIGTFSEDVNNVDRHGSQVSYSYNVSPALTQIRPSVEVAFSFLRRSPQRSLHYMSIVAQPRR